jgi:RimJ/RimL family protein N-acetyltransferase
MKSINFKLLTENDLPLLLTWFQKPLVKQWYARGESYTLDMIKEKYLPRILNPESIPNFIVYADSTPIGYIQLYCVKDSLPDGVTDYNYPLFDSFKPNEIAGIDLFIADENYLKRGYATLTLTNFIKEYVQGKFSLLVADPLKSNKNAIQFFEKNGFKKIKHNKTKNELMTLHIVSRMLDTTKIILTTDRLILRTWKTSDIPLMAAISSDPLVMEHFPATQDIAATEALVNHINQHYEKFGYALYAVEIKDTHEFIGFVGLNHPPFEIPNFKPKSLPVVEIDWRLSSKHWSKGYATEAAKAVLHYAFTELNLGEIISFTVVANTKSRRVMEKIGLHHSEADHFDHPKLEENSPLKRHILYRITRDNYQKNDDKRENND